MSIDERSKKVSEAWSFMNQKEKKNYGLKGNTEWICDPYRKQLHENEEPQVINKKSAKLQKDSGNVNEIVDDKTISFIQFPNLSIKKRFFQPQNDLFEINEVISIL